jgi:hypothetical protein
VTVEDLEKTAWLALVVNPPTQVYIYGPEELAEASAALASALPRAKATLSKLSPRRRRRLIAPLVGDEAGEASYVIIDVTEELRCDIEELGARASEAKSQIGGSVDITLRGKVEAITLYYIDPEAPDTWWESFESAGVPAWIPEDVETEYLAKQTSVFRSDCHGMQVWDDTTNSIRFTCYPKHSDGRIESADLEELLYPQATREAKL